MTSANATPDASQSPTDPATPKKAKTERAKKVTAKKSPSPELSSYIKFKSTIVHRAELKNAPYNPRTISTDARRRLKANIQRIGLVDPPVWNRRTGNIVGGHQRINILDSLERSKDYMVPVNEVDLSDVEEKEQNLFLNNENAQGEWDLDLLLVMVKDEEVDIDNAGFDLGDVYTLFGDDAIGDQAEKLTEMSERLEDARVAAEDIQDEIKPTDDIEYYCVIVFASTVERELFQETLSLPKDIFVDGRRVWKSLQDSGAVIDETDEDAALTKFLDVKSCQRCCAKHLKLVFRPLTNASGEYDYYATCPVTGEPVLMHIAPSSQKQAASETPQTQ